MKRQDIITDISENMANIKRLMFASFAHIHSNKPTMAQMSVLFIVSHLEKPTIKEISAYSKISPPAATQLVNALVQKKFLTRNTDKKDKRKTNLVVTEVGRKIL